MRLKTDMMKTQYMLKVVFIVSFFICHQLQPTDRLPLLTSEEIILNLETAIRAALDSNRMLQDAAENVYLSGVTLSLAERDLELKVNPRIDMGCIGGGYAGTGFTAGLGLDLDKKFLYGTQITAGPAVLKAADHYNTNVIVRLAQPLLRGFGKETTLAGIRSAEYAARCAKRSFYKSTIIVIYRTIELMFEIAKQEKLLEMDKISYARLERFFKATKIKERVGLSDALDVYRAEIELKQAEDALLQSVERLQDAKDNLSDHLSLPPETALQIDLPITYIEEDWDLEEAISIAMDNRIEFEEVWDALQETQRQSYLAKNSLLPDLNMVVDYSNVGGFEEFTGAFYKNRESRWGVGFTSTSGFDRRAEQAYYEQSLMNVENAHRNCFDVKNAIIQEVKRTKRFYDRARQKIELQKNQIGSVEGELKLAQAKFLRGLANNFDVIQAEKTMRAAQTALITAIIEYRLGDYKLKAAVGTLVGVENETF